MQGNRRTLIFTGSRSATSGYPRLRPPNTEPETTTRTPPPGGVRISEGPMSIDQYSTTPANNDLVNYFKTGMRPSAVKNAGWDIMADLASYIVSLPTAGGTANALTVSNGRPFGALVAGLVQVLNPGSPNTGPATFAPDGLTAKNIF